jgi:hypothetical protein
LRAQHELGKAQDALDHMDKKGNFDPLYDKAIDHFKKAWDHSNKALKKGA